MLRQILQLQRRRIQFRFDPFHLHQTIRLYRWKSAGSDRFICGVLFFSGFFFFPCLLQRINQKRTIVRGLRFAFSGIAKLVRSFCKFVCAQIQQTEVHRIVVLFGIEFRRAPERRDSFRGFSRPCAGETQIVQNFRQVRAGNEIVF